MRTGLIFLPVTAVFVILRGCNAHTTHMENANRTMDAVHGLAKGDEVGYLSDSASPSDGCEFGGDE
ncbi:MAG: hypothetical protein HC804_11875 [Anaerolineae bacterium]|nr:hypothetical protein [Anaerolineae bacterium]